MDSKSKCGQTDNICVWREIKEKKKCESESERGKSVRVRVREKKKCEIESERGKEV